MLFHMFEVKQNKMALEISTIMSDVLNVENMNNSDDIFSEIGSLFSNIFLNFFRQSTNWKLIYKGVDSMSSMRIYSSIKEKLGKDIPLNLFLSSSNLSVNEIANFLVSQDEIGSSYARIYFFFSYHYQLLLIIFQKQKRKEIQRQTKISNQ